LVRAQRLSNGDSGKRDARSLSAPDLVAVLDLVGEWLSEANLSGRFSVDPPGSFEVDDSVPPVVLDVLQKAAERGAVLYVGSGEDDAPEQLKGCRLRLSFMLSPRYKLTLRNQPPV